MFKSKSLNPTTSEVRSSIGCNLPSIIDVITECFDGKQQLVNTVSGSGEATLKSGLSSAPDVKASQVETLGVRMYRTSSTIQERCGTPTLENITQQPKLNDSPLEVHPVPTTIEPTLPTIEITPPSNIAISLPDLSLEAKLLGE